MPYYRRLPSGLRQAIVRGLDGKRHTKTDKLKSVVKQWATEQEVAIARVSSGICCSVTSRWGSGGAGSPPPVRQIR